MANTVLFRAPQRELGRADIKFIVRQGTGLVGTLYIGKGSVDWVPANDQYGYRLDWTDLDRIMQANGVRKRRSRTQ